MTKLVNRAKMTTATTGTGSPITLGSAVDGYQTFADAGVVNSDVVRYVIEDGVNWEIGSGTYSAGTLTRTVSESSNADAAINLSGEAVVYVTAAAADIVQPSDLATVATTGAYSDLSGLPTLYSDASVDTHLNTGTASSGEVLSWNGSDYDWVAAPAALTGQTDSASPFETSLGSGAGAVNTGVNNTFIGFEAGNDNTSGEGNVAIGYQALDVNTTGSQNVAIGASALGANVGGIRNTAVGEQSGINITSGLENSLLGYLCGRNITTGRGNVVLGLESYISATTGGRNIAIGYQTMNFGNATTANADNIAIGFNAGQDISTGIQNTLIGPEAGRNITSGTDNFAAGRRSMLSLTTGSNNVAIGNGALDAATTGGNNIAIGQGAMGVGVATAASGDNVAIGWRAGEDLTSGFSNTLLGANSGRSLTTGYLNCAFGDSALAGATTAIGNTSIGLNAHSSVTGDNNTALGRNAGQIGSGSNNTIIGYNASASASTVSNEITLGNGSITNFRVPGVGFQFDTTDGLIVPKTVTAGGTTGAQTINKTAGTVNFAAAATSLVVTNSFVDTNSIIIATVGTDDITMKSVAVVAGAGSFTLYANAAATAETRVNWFVVN